MILLLFRKCHCLFLSKSSRGRVWYGIVPPRTYLNSLAEGGNKEDQIPDLHTSYWKIESKVPVVVWWWCQEISAGYPRSGGAEVMKVLVLGRARSPLVLRVVVLLALLRGLDVVCT